MPYRYTLLVYLVGYTIITHAEPIRMRAAANENMLSTARARRGGRGMVEKEVIDYERYEGFHFFLPSYMYWSHGARGSKKKTVVSS